MAEPDEPDDYRINPLLNPGKYISHVRTGLNYIRPILEGMVNAVASELENCYDGLLGDAIRMKKLLDEEKTLVGSDREKMKNVRDVFLDLVNEIGGKGVSVDLKMNDLEWQATHNS